METDDYKIGIDDEDEPMLEDSIGAVEVDASEELPATEEHHMSEEPKEVDPALADWFKIDDKTAAKPVDSDTATENDSENEDVKDEENEDDDWLKLTLSGDSVDSEAVIDKVSLCVFI